MPWYGPKRNNDIEAVLRHCRHATKEIIDGATVWFRPRSTQDGTAQFEGVIDSPLGHREIGGIKFTADEKISGWSIGDYLDGVQAFAKESR